MKRRPGLIGTVKGMASRALKWLYYRTATSGPAVALQRKRADPDRARWRWETAPPPASPKVCVFVTYAPDGTIPERAIGHAAVWREQGYLVVFVVALDDFSIHPTIPFGHAMCRENAGHDFGAWARALAELPLERTQILATVNDSVFHANSLSAAIRRAEQSSADTIGFTDSREYRWHIQSYAVVFKGECLRSKAFKRFWTPRLGSRRHVIWTYETQMARTLRAAGFRTEVLFPLNKPDNPTDHHWPELAAKGFPYVKRSHLPWRYDEWRPHFARYGFDAELIAADTGRPPR